MVRFERSARIAQGKLLEARKWAQEVTQYANSNHPDGKLLVFSERFGNIGRVSWQADFEDIATLDRYQASFDTDEGYWALLGKSADLFVEDSVKDTVYEAL